MTDRHRRHRPPFREAGKLTTWLLDRVDMDAVTMPWGLIYLRKSDYRDRYLRKHELVHLRQIQKLGWSFWSSLYAQYIVFGHDHAPFEIEARMYSYLPVRVWRSYRRAKFNSEEILNA